jgi:maltose alpha-D-glucosyltransferase/alpha-amylase
MTSTTSSERAVKLADPIVLPEGQALPATATETQDPLWYRDAVIYELHVKAFADANGDGIGDFAGLARHLDHVQSLGVNTIWLLPFYPSPLRDDGYDVADYESVHPMYGDLDDFRGFVAEAHRRGLRVITELVVNHTSDQHPWFQRARRAPKDSPERDFYVWSDDPNKYAGTRIIFTDTEKSNWAWDEVAGQYYWHRFFSHQPDLNFDNPQVLEAVLNVMEFWLEIGVDGFRLDAIPYLIEREGTSNENLRETHEVIKQIRRRIDADYPGRMLLAEANMWPEDVREYFGEDDECHVAYHFPLMPRMYMAIAQEDRHPVVEILAQTPDIPANCQWAIFLRNHDELTLEMVTSKERDYMYSMYAADSRARINLGIRRRLAPLLENDRARIELMNALLLSMPGTPVLYYGDEIGMGDNIFLGDRDGVRTPMQWASDRNGGFSRADPQRLYLPPIQDPIYGFEALNVEAQSREPSSLLNWTRRMLAVRRTTHAFGRGRFTMLHPGNRKILAYLREYEDEMILCVANVSRSAQPVELDLARCKGRVPVEMLGRNAFPPIGELPYMLTLPAHGFYWFRLTTDVAPPDWHTEMLPVEDLQTVVLFDGWNSFFRERVVPWRIGLAEKTRRQLEVDLLPRFVARQRWFAGKGGTVTRVRLIDDVLLEHERRSWLFTQVEIDVDGVKPSQRYLLPLALVWEDTEEERSRHLAPAALAKARQQASVGLVADAFADDLFCSAVVQAMLDGRTLRSSGGSLRFTAAKALPAVLAAMPPGPWPQRNLAKSSNSVVLIADALFLKGYRRVQAGVNPEAEVGRFLTEVAQFEHCVPMLGTIEHVDAEGTVRTLALLQAQVPNQGDAWKLTVDMLVRQLADLGGRDLPQDRVEIVGGYAELAARLAQRTAQMHAAFARPSGDAAFEAEPMTGADIERWTGSVQQAVEETLAALAQAGEHLAPELAATTQRVLAAGPTLRNIVARAGAVPPVGMKTRLHGDYHLEQILVQKNDFVIIDFEGEPVRSLDERREKNSVLRDVAGMLRSLDYARQTALNQVAGTVPELERMAPLADAWLRSVRGIFLDGWRDAAIGDGLFKDAADFEALRPLLDLFELDKALYELRYELKNRPDWVAVPLAGLAALAAQGQPAQTA